MDIMHKMDQGDYSLEYYFIVILSLLTFRKIKRVERLKAEINLRKKRIPAGKCEAKYKPKIP